MNKENMAKYAIKQFIGHQQQQQQQSADHRQTAEQIQLEQQQKKRWWKKAEPPDAILSPQERDVLKRVKKRAILLDKGMNCCCCQVGLDGIVGLFPVVGDALGLLLALQLVHMAMEADLPKSIVSKMMFNITFDFFIGVVPVVGDILDIMFKANTKNAILLEDYLIKRRRGLIDPSIGSNREALLPTHHHGASGPSAPAFR
ncbi:hypothetical protein HMPREF1544_03201 [Mucor circinelloides 1006PhL]|uniref:DUF4112 domain-containing protein n=1 Tax=Mucor circinelloides f. circinelloides (strain 1006PhL) TaxID=1220926 RepID=S2JN71_MUCC1|nr:hypothetical protein HMPREF1544_03201 [Mucor circinelloides 1006PhL]